jgi:DNA-binding transcriptional regulator LsrR (DeoR family)
MAVGQELDIRNADPLPHRIAAFTRGEESLFHVDLPLTNQLVRKRMKREGVVRIQASDGHDWASAVIVVVSSRVTLPVSMVTFFALFT